MITTEQYYEAIKEHVWDSAEETEYYEEVKDGKYQITSHKDEYTLSIKRKVARLITATDLPFKSLFIKQYLCPHGYYWDEELQLGVIARVRTISHNYAWCDRRGKGGLFISDGEFDILTKHVPDLPRTILIFGYTNDPMVYGYTANPELGHDALMLVTPATNFERPYSNRDMYETKGKALHTKHWFSADQVPSKLPEWAAAFGELPIETSRVLDLT